MLMKDITKYLLALVLISLIGMCATSCRSYRVIPKKDIVFHYPNGMFGYRVSPTNEDVLATPNVSDHFIKSLFIGSRRAVRIKIAGPLRVAVDANEGVPSYL